MKVNILVNCDGQIVDAGTLLITNNRKIKNKATSINYVRHIVEGLRKFAVPEKYIDHILDISIVNNNSGPKSRDNQIAFAQLRLKEIRKTFTKD